MHVVIAIISLFLVMIPIWIMDIDFGFFGGFLVMIIWFAVWGLVELAISGIKSTYNKSVEAIKNRPPSPKEQQKQAEAAKIKAEETEKQRLENYMKEEEPVFKSITDTRVVNIRFPLERWLNEKMKEIISLKNEIAFEQEVISFLKRKKEAYVHYGLDTTWLDERADASLSKLSSMQHELGGQAICLCENTAKIYLGSQNLLRDFIQGFPEIKKEIYLNGVIEDVKWYEFNSTHFVAWTPICILLAEKSSLNTRIYLYNELTIVESTSTTRKGSEKTYTVKIVSQNGETRVYEKNITATKRSKIEQYISMLSNKEESRFVSKMLDCHEAPNFDSIQADLAEEKKKEEQEKSRRFLEKGEPTVKPKYHLTFANTNIPFGKVVQNVFQTFIDRLNGLDKAEKHLVYLKKKHEAEICINDEDSSAATLKMIAECEELIKTQKRESGQPISAYRELSGSDTKDQQNKYQKAIIGVEKEFLKIAKEIAVDSNPPEPFGTFLKGKPMLALKDDVALFFFPYFLVLLTQKDKDAFAVEYLEYDKVSIVSSHETVSLRYGESLPKGAERASTTWEHQRADGSPDMRYRDNRARYSYYVGIATLKVGTYKKVFKYQTRQKAKDIAELLKKYQSTLTADIVKQIVDVMYQSQDVPSFDAIISNIIEEEFLKKEAEKQEKQRILQEQRAAQKRAEEERKAAEKRAEEERKQKLEELRLARLQREEEKRRLEQEQTEREERIRKELAQKEKDEQLILEQRARQESNANGSKIFSVGDVISMSQNTDDLPIDDSDKKVITNSIVRRRFIHKTSKFDCEKYSIWFMDKKGNEISEKRIVDRKESNSITELSFELKSSNGFSSSETYYLVVTDFTTGALLGSIAYKINIAFANDFDF